MILEYNSKNMRNHQQNFGRLLSPVFDLERSDKICISFKYSFKPGSYGKFLQKFYKKEENKKNFFFMFILINLKVKKLYTKKIFL